MIITRYMARAYELLLCGQFIMCLINLKGYLFELVWHSYPWLLFKSPSLRHTLGYYSNLLPSDNFFFVKCENFLKK